jgi:hypothetical protein
VWSGVGTGEACGEEKTRMRRLHVHVPVHHLSQSVRCHSTLLDAHVGLGIARARALERDARSAGVRTLVLPTRAAVALCAQQRFAASDRAYAPEEVKASAEFRAPCPASAVCVVNFQH